MIAIPEVVRNIIKKSPYLNEALSLQIINLSALARLIKPEVERELMKEVQQGAIIMALNRESHITQTKHHQQQKLFPSPSDLMVRSNLIEVTLANSELLIPKQKRLLEHLSRGRNYFITITQGIFEMTIIASRELKNSILAIFEGEKIITTLENLSSLTVRLPEGNAFIPGIYNYILKALAWEGINIIEVVSTFNEFTLILEDKNIDFAFSIIKRLIES